MCRRRPQLQAGQRAGFVLALCPGQWPPWFSAAPQPRLISCFPGPRPGIRGSSGSCLERHLEPSVGARRHRFWALFIVTALFQVAVSIIFAFFCIAGTSCRRMFTPLDCELRFLDCPVQPRAGPAAPGTGPALCRWGPASDTIHGSAPGAGLLGDSCTHA